MGKEEQEQVEEMNRIRDAILTKGLATAGRVHAKDLCLVYTALNYEAHVKGTNMSKEEIREVMKGMVDFIIDHTDLIQKKDIN